MSQVEKNTVLEQRGCFYLTLNVVECIDIFIRPVYKQVIVESLNYFTDKKGLTVYAWCLMTNHLQLMLQANDGYELAPIITDLKKFTSRLILEDIDVEPEARRKWMMEKFRKANDHFKFSGTFQVWQAESNIVAIDLRNKNLVQAQLEQIHCTPVRDRIVMLPEDYLYSSACDYAGVRGLVKVELITEKQEPDFLLRHLSSYRHIH